MCRNIKVLHNFEPAATPEEVEAAALQYVRKISGSTKPSKANEAAFARAVDEVTAASRRLLDALVTSAPPRDREVEAAKARARAAARFGAAAYSPRVGALLSLRSPLIIGLLARFAVPARIRCRSADDPARSAGSVVGGIAAGLELP